jgi:hypothetical protein
MELGGESRLKRAKKYLKEFENASRGDGNYTANSSSGQVIGTFTSNITNKTFKIYNQCAITGWGSYCNRATAIAIASGYTKKSDSDLIKIANNCNPKPLSDVSGTTVFFNKFGLKAKYMGAPGNYVATMKKNLQAGQYAALHVVGSGYTGKSGKRWASVSGAMHWVSILGYRNQDGKDQMFIGDSGHGNTGWYNMDEFMKNGGKEIDMLYYIYK